MGNFRFFDRLLVIAGVFLVMFVVAAMLTPLVSSWFPDNERYRLLAMAVVQSVVGFIIPSLIGTKIAFGNSIRFLTLSVPPSGMNILGVVIAYLISLPLLNQLIFWNQNIVFPEAFEHVGVMFRDMEDRATEVSNTMLDTSTVGGMLVGVLIIGVLTGFSEELFFRGALQRAGASRGAHHTSIWVTALIFSAIHFQVFGFFPRLLLGAWFGYLLYWTGSIYVPFVAHALNNSVVVICAYFFPAREGSHPDMIGVTTFGFPLPAFVSAVAMMIFVVCFKDLFFSGRGLPAAEVKTAEA